MPVFIGEKRKFEPEPEELSLAGTTATADTPPATLEPPDAKIVKAEGKASFLVYDDGSVYVTTIEMLQVS